MVFPILIKIYWIITGQWIKWSKLKKIIKEKNGTIIINTFYFRYDTWIDEEISNSQETKNKKIIYTKISEEEKDEDYIKNNFPGVKIIYVETKF